MKKIVKIVTFYDDGTFSESVPSAPFSPMPSTPYPDTLPRPYTIPTPYWESKKCPKCGINLDGPMGYVCPNNPCPTGLGGVYCKAET